MKVNLQLSLDQPDWPYTGKRVRAWVPAYVCIVGVCVCVCVCNVLYQRERSLPPQRGYSSLTLMSMVGEYIWVMWKTWVSITPWPFHWSPFVRRFVYNKPKVKLSTALTTQNTTENTANNCYFLTRTKHNCTSAQCIFNRNISASDHMQRTVGFPQHKPSSRST
jgi:hypothetical protein